ncbi:hypothetical protein DPMN_189062 [Dreissena polymorpha]|uniref:Uncharacterized protein n=1 Tax=Dreissena polymorpha TaxID=45954 RepID=A0A9D4DRV4_DREPO|nr:hypothetical protein DPMN_189062 [Dreissena polymorpha]
MIRSKKRPVPVTGKSVITNFLVRINNEPSLSESSISERESVQDVASDRETSQPPTKRPSSVPVGSIVVGSKIFHGSQKLKEVRVLSSLPHLGYITSI